MPDEIVFSTLHGSRLYGFAHEGSDFDTFTVTTSRSTRVRQAVDAAGNDRVHVGIWRFLDLATSGSHQSVEALFSPLKEWGPASVQYRPMLENMLIVGGSVFEKYERTIRKFCYGDLKRRRHAVRLALNLDDLRITGRIGSVQLPDSQVAYCTRLATDLEGDALANYLHVLRKNDA